jgi:hypothetical protein
MSIGSEYGMEEMLPYLRSMVHLTNYVHISTLSLNYSCRVPH